MQVDDGAPLERMLAPDEINEALSALHLRNVPVIEVGTDSEAEGMEPALQGSARASSSAARPRARAARRPPGCAAGSARHPPPCEPG